MLPQTARMLSIALAIGSLVTACSTDERSTPVASVTTSSPTPSSTAPSTVPGPTTSTTTATTTPTTTPATTTPATTTPATTTPATTVTSTVPATTVPPASPSVAVDRLPTDAPVVALTFDAGSDLGNLGVVLDVLSEHGVAASFGITGAFADAHPDDVRRIALEGHLVMNHSYSHSSFTGLSSDDVLSSTEARQDDLERADAVLAPLVGRSTAPFWRPPFGDYDQSVLDDVGALGYAYSVLWTVDSLGWQGLSAAQITDRVLDRASPGAIVLMHVGSQSADAESLPAMIAGLRAAGYSFTTVSSALDG